MYKPSHSEASRGEQRLSRSKGHGPQNVSVPEESVAGEVGETPREESLEPVESAHVRPNGDGTYKYTLHGRHGSVQSYDFHNWQSMSNAMKDHMTSPHMPELGSGLRFSHLSDQLSRQPGIRNPDALAAYSGRKKYGNSRFAKLSEGGR